jgi:hypothetical protein
MIVNKQPYVVSEWNEELRYYINTWYDYVEESDFIDAVEIGRQFMITNKVKYHLADTTYMDGVWDGGEWLYENFWKNVVAHGLTHFGLVLSPDNYYGNVSDYVMQQEMKRRGISIEYKTFKTLEEAQNWIRELNPLLAAV